VTLLITISIYNQNNHNGLEVDDVWRITLENRASGHWPIGLNGPRLRSALYFIRIYYLHLHRLQLSIAQCNLPYLLLTQWSCREMQRFSIFGNTIQCNQLTIHPDF